MQRLLLLLAAVAAIAAPSASATSFPTGVPFFACAFSGGGTATVPAGTPVSVWFAWYDRNRGLVQDYLNAQTTIATVDGVPVADTSSYYTPIAYDADLGEDITFWDFPSGTTLAAGQSIVVSIDIVLSHKLEEGKVDGKTVFSPPGSLFGGPLSCTITGV